MKDIVIKIDRKTSQVFLNKKVLGISGENLQGNLIFEFIDDFVDGLAWLELEIGQTKGYLALIKEDNSYKLPILSSLLANKGNITMQLRITENEDANGIPIFKSNMFYLEVKEAINSVKEIMEEYPNWFEQVNEKISVIQTDGKGNKYLSDDGTYKYVQGGSSDGGNVDLSNYATKDDLLNKVDKELGKSLISNNEIERLANVTNYDDTAIKNQINSKASISDMTDYIEEHKDELKGDKGDTGERGLTGKSGVYVGTEEPTDPNVNVWINPDGEGTDEIATKEYVDEAIKNISGGTGGTIIDAQFNIIDGFLQMEYTTMNVDFNINNNGELEVII